MPTRSSPVARLSALGAVVLCTIAQGADAGVRLIDVRPVAIDRTDKRILIDLGSVTFAKVDLNATAGNVADNVTVTLREDRSPTPLPNTGPEPIGVRFYREVMPIRVGRNTPKLTEKDARLMPADIGRVMPLRYIEISGWKGDFSSANLTVRAAIADTWAPRGTLNFTGDSRAYWLNRLWRLMSHTMKVTSFADIFVDGDRERLPYEADGYINQLGWYATTGDITVPRRTFEYLIANPNWPTEWQSHMIFMAWADYMYTGDVAYLARHYDRLKFLSLEGLASPDGLISIKDQTEAFKKESRLTYPIGDIVDWPQNQRDGYVMGDVNLATNAIAYRAMVLLSDIAGVLGKSDNQAHYLAQAKRMREGIDKAFRLPSGLYADSIGSTHVAAHSLFMPLAFGLVDDARKPLFVRALRQRILAYDGGIPASVYGAQYLLEGLFDVGQDDLALSVILNTTDRGWMNMLNKYDATVTHEAWDVKFKDNEDWTHAWGAAPANILPRYVIGIEALRPGWTRWRIRPSAALTFSATATVPTIHGDAKIALIRDKGEAVVTVPEGTTAEFVDAAGTQVLPPGVHTIVWTPPR